MKKIISIIFTVLFFLVPFVVVHAADSVILTVDGDVEGEIYELLDNQIVTLELSKTNYSFDINDGDDITAWFTNIPSNLTATVDYNNLNTLDVLFEGYETSEIEEIIEVNIPDGVVLDNNSNPIGPLSNDVSTEDSKYIIKDLTPIAYYNEPSTVSGYVGETLETQYVYIKIENDAYNSSIINQTLRTYNGLTATVVEYVSNIAKVKYEGIPLVEDHSLIHSVIDKSYLTISSNNLIVPDRIDVLFDINVRPIVVQSVPEPEPPIIHTYSIPTTGIE